MKTLCENDDDCSDLSSQSKDNEKSGFFFSLDGSKEDVDSEDKDDVSDEVSSSVDDGFESLYLMKLLDSDDVEVVDSGDKRNLGFFFF